jgi:hypothetical protein
MNSHARREAGLRNTGALLVSMVEDAIKETLAPPPPREPAPQAEPVSAAGFLADAAAFLRARPDATELLARLHAMIGDAQEPSSRATSDSPPTEPPPADLVPGAQAAGTETPPAEG